MTISISLKKIYFILILSALTTNIHAQLPGNWNPSPQTTTSNAIGIGTITPSGWQEIKYCDDNQNGLVITNILCPFTPALTHPVSFDGVAHPLITLDPVGGEGGVGGITIPYPLADFTLRPYGTFLNSHPMLWARVQNNSIYSAISSGAYSSRFIVTPSGEAGVNIEAPRATFDIKSLGYYNYPGLIVGHQQQSSATRTQHVMFIPLLQANGYNKISQQNDQGMFFTDGNGTDGSNLDGALVIAPWTTGISMTGLRIDKNGNVGIGTANAFGYKLAVNGTASFKEIEMKPTTAWPDYVFDSTYINTRLLSFNQLKDTLLNAKKLPNMPSAKEAEENGVKQMELNTKLLENVETLYLYIIQLNDEVNRLKTKLEEVEKEK